MPPAPASVRQGTPAAGATGQSSDLDTLVARALAASPLPRAAAARLEAAQAGVTPAGARPDPMLMAGLQNLPVSAPGFADEMTMAMVGIGQAIPARGKLALRRRTAERQVDAARAEVERVRLEVARDVRVAFYDLAYLDQALAGVERNRRALVDLVRVAEARYGAGADPAPGLSEGGAAGAASISGARSPSSAAPPMSPRSPSGSAAGGGTNSGGMAGMSAGVGGAAGVTPPTSMGAGAVGGSTMAASASGMTASGMAGGNMGARGGMTGSPLQGILRARTDLARLGEDASALHEERRAALARLNAVLDRPSNTPVDGPRVPDRIARAAVADSGRDVRFASAALGARAADSPLPTVEALQALAAGRSPALRAHEALIAAQGTQVELARRERTPDIDVAVQYGVRPRHADMITATVSVPLPIQRGRVQDQAVAGARAELAALEAEHHRQLNALRAEVARLHAEAERARTQLALLKAVVLPQAHATLAAGAVSYQAGQAGLSVVLEARAAVFNQETAYYRALSEFAKAIAELELVVGGEVLP